MTFNKIYVILYIEKQKELTIMFDKVMTKIGEIFAGVLVTIGLYAVCVLFTLMFWKEFLKMKDII